MTHIYSCWRCGVEFDGVDYLSGAPCSDCQLEETTEYRKLNVVAAAEELRRQKLVQELWESRQPDNRIAEAIGLTVRQVVSTRNKLGLVGHVFQGTELWDDVDTVRERIREASQRYWDDPENKRRKREHGPAVEGQLALSEEQKLLIEQREIDRRRGQGFGRGRDDYKRGGIYGSI